MRIGDTPEGLVDRACAAAMEAATEVVLAADADLTRIIVLLEIEGQPAGEDDACSAGYGFEDSRELAAVVMSNAISMLKALGVNAEIHTFDPRARSMS